MESIFNLLQQGGLLLNPDSAAGFTCGFAVGGILLCLVVLLIHLVTHRRNTCDTIVVEGDAGSLYITSNAVREFVSRILGEYQEASLHTIVLRQKRDLLILQVDVDVLPDTSVVPLVERLRTEIISEAGEKLGITMPIRVNVSLRSLSAKEKRIVRQQKRVGVNVNTASQNVPGEAPDETAKQSPPSEAETDYTGLTDSPNETAKTKTAPNKGGDEDERNALNSP